MSAILLSLTLLASPPDGADLEASAREAFAAGVRQREQGQPGDREFKRAALALEELRRRGYDSPDLHRALGNAWLLAGDLPRAIFSYRLGLRHAPRDGELRHLLDWARGQVVYPEGSRLGRVPDTDRPPWLSLPGTGTLFVLATLLHLTGWLCLLRGRIRLSTGWWAAGAALVAAALAAGGLAARQQWAEPDPPLAVVSRDGVHLRKGDDANFPPWEETPLNRGVEAGVLFRRGGWLRVRLSGGEVGWIHRSEVVCEEDDS